VRQAARYGARNTGDFQDSAKMSSDPLVVFTPSGKRGRFPKGTPVLTAARQLGRRS
jgi:hypothetical protein